MAGVCQLLEAITATFGQVIVLGKLVVSGDAAATSANILEHQHLYWWGFAASILAVLLNLVWIFLMYELLKIVNRRISIVAILVMLMGCAMLAVTALFYLAPLVILQGGAALSSFTTAQLQALAVAFLRLNTYAFDMHTVFFGVWCVLTGYLIFKSRFLPRVLGILLMVSGLAWMLYFSPPLAVHLFPFIAAASAIGEIPLELWLIVFGLNEARWKEQATLA
ncbi:MAG TPA: DUF4386 domain-containing protein [Candidatus Acidoferrum sp.]|nr:DUF4386 domain-containing protein [Candidatus Acidoferrum sp.]